jgi:diguanylate cyclase (GGDEF)-like protein
MTRKQFEAAERELALAIELAHSIAPHNAVCLGVLHCTRAELRMAEGEPAEALAEAERALALLAAFDEPNPYLFGMTVKLEVQALLALGRPDEAQRCGTRAVARLGDRVPQARSLILSTVASALREAGRTDQAYEALAQGAALERRALQELTEMQLGFERATLQARAARIEADALAAKNRELEDAHAQLAQAHAELQERTAQLETLQARLREQADRDALTGLHNRRYLDTEYARIGRGPLDAPISVAVLDLDDFKSVNDRFGHAAGDRVLERTAALLRSIVRPADTVARTGGEEFVLLMPGTDADAAGAVCARMVAALRAETWRRIGDDLRVTASAGVATAPAGERLDLEGLTRVADQRLYAAKRAGRDRVVGGE